MHRTIALLLSGLLLTIVVPVASSDGATPVNVVVNGNFEAYADTTGTGGFSDQALWWTSGLSSGYQSNTEFRDSGLDDDDDREAIVPADPSAGTHNFWQSFPLPPRAFSANFDRFEFTVEAGTIADGANNQIGFQLSPSYAQHPYVGTFWEGAMKFDAADMEIGPNGRVSMDPVADGEIICPDWQPCRDFKADYDAADADGKRDLLGQARIAQISFWNFNRQDTGKIVIDDVALLGATTVAEELAGANVNPNPAP